MGRAGLVERRAVAKRAENQLEEDLEDVLIRTADDVTRFIENRRVSRSAKWIVLIALGGTFIDAYDFSSLGIGVPGLKAEFHLSPFLLGSVTAVMAVGALCGALFGGYYTDKVGRLKMFMLDLVCLVVAAVGAALSPNVYSLLFFRFLMGLGVGLDFPVAFSFIAESVSARVKGGSVNLWGTVWFVAVACSVFVVLPFYYSGAGNELWRWAVGFGALPALIVLILRYRFMYESPMWAAHSLGLPAAGRILERTYNIRVRVEPLAVSATHAADTQYTRIFDGSHLSRTMLISIVCITQSLEYFAVAFNLPTWSQQLFGKGFLFAALATLVSALVGGVASILSALLIDRVGVRRLVFTGYAVVSASLLVLWGVWGSAPMILSAGLVYLFLFGHALGPGPLGMTMATLSYPTEIRGIGTGWAQAMCRVGSTAGFYFFPLMMAAVGPAHMMLILTAVPLIGLTAVLCVAWEPVGRDIEGEGSLSPQLQVAASD